MKSITWKLSEFGDPLEIAESLREALRPHEVVIDNLEGYSRRIEQLTELVVAAGKEQWGPLDVLKANAIKYGPQYRFRLQIDGYIVHGFVNKCEICFLFEDSVDEETVSRIRLACSRIKGAIEDQIDAGES